MKSLLKSRILWTALPMLMFCVLFSAGCSQNQSPLSTEMLEAHVKTVQSANGAFTLLNVDQHKRDAMDSWSGEEQKIYKYTSIDQYYAEALIEWDSDKTLKLGDGETGESKVEFKKGHLPETMTVSFEWAPDDLNYRGCIIKKGEPGLALVFSDSVFIEASYKMAYLSEVDESALALYAFNSALSQWQKLPSIVDMGNKRVESYVHGFCEIALFYSKDGRTCQLTKVQDVDYYERKFCEMGGDKTLDVQGVGLDKSELKIMKYSLPQDLTIDFEWASGTLFNGLVTSVELGTEVHLNIAAPIKVSYKNASLLEVNEDSLGLYLHNKESGMWDLLAGSVDKDKRIVTGQLPRFGRIALLYSDAGALFDLVKLGEYEFYTRKFIKQNGGGTLHVGNKVTGKTQIKFKKWDLPKDSEIEFEWAATQYLEGFLNDIHFGPEGIAFNTPVEVRLSYKLADLTDVNEETICVVYYNPETGLWENLGGIVDIGKKKITVYLNHFSRYALSTGGR